MGTAREELIELLNQEALFGMRKLFGMFGQIQVLVTDVTPERLTVSIWTRHELEGAPLARNVRNAVMSWLRDLVPVLEFRAVYDNPDLGIMGEVHDLPYGEALSSRGLGSSAIANEQVVGPEREKLRKPFRKAWRRLSEDRRTASR